jgi:hypothetical protein
LVNEIFNERLKLTAAWMNQLATAIAAAGVFAPLASLLFGFQLLQVPPGSVLSLVVNCAALAGGLHVFGRWLLGTLRP